MHFFWVRHPSWPSTHEDRIPLLLSRSPGHGHRRARLHRQQSGPAARRRRRRGPDRRFARCRLRRQPVQHLTASRTACASTKPTSATRASMDVLVQDREVIFNLAGQVSHIDSMRDPYTDLDINCRAQLSMLEACRKYNPGVRVVYAGTRQVYGRPDRLPVDESHLVRPDRHQRRQQGGRRELPSRSTTTSSASAPARSG